MVAIVTDTFKKQFATYLFDEVSSGTDSHEYYIGIGKADAYDSSDNTVTPLRHLAEEREARNNIQSVKKVTGHSFVIPRYNWSSGAIYNAYADNVVGIATNTYYVLTDANEVYICLQQGKNANGTANTSTVKPDYNAAGVNQVQAFETADGYRWKLAYAVSAVRSSAFLSSGFIPVQNVTVDSASANTFELQQLNIQNTVTPGQIIGVEVVDGGTGYSSAPTITFKGNGSGASATATIASGAIVKVEMNNESAGMGSGYDYASATVTGDATLRPIIGPKLGLGKDARTDLKSSSIMFNVKTDGTENDTFNITNDFRQILLMRDIFEIDSTLGSGKQFTNASAKANRFLTLTGTIAAGGFAVDETITGGTSGVTAFIDELDSNNGNKIFYHQNSNNVAGDFQDGETITSSGSGSATLDSAVQHSIVDNHSGDLLYIENRARVVRASAQTEDLKIIITV